MVGCLFGGLIDFSDWLTGWLDGRLIVWLIDCLVGLFDWLLERLIV